MNDDAPWPIKAYENLDFIKSREGRALRIMSEFLEPESRLSKFDIQDTIAFMGSARIPSEEQARKEMEQATAADAIDRAAERLKLSRYYEDTRKLAFKMTEWSKNLKGNDRRFVVCTGAAQASWRRPTAARRKPRASTWGSTSLCRWSSTKTLT